MKKLIAVLGMLSTLLAGSASAAELGWTAEPLTKDETSIKTEGTLKYAYAEEDTDSGTYTVNGVTFTCKQNPSCSDFSFKNGTTSGMRGSSTPPSDVSGDYASLLQYGWWNNSGECTLKLKNLEAGKSYMVQLIICNSNKGWSSAPGYTVAYAPNSESICVNASGEGWEHGGSLIGVFTATVTTQEFTLTYVGGNAWINGLQLREVELGPTVSDPSIGSASVSTSIKNATFSLAGVKLGTDAEGTAATKYSVWYQLNDNAAVEKLTGQTGSTASFTLEDLAEGDYTNRIWITTDTPKTSATNEVAFSIDVKPLAPFAALKARIENATSGEVVEIGAANFEATDTITVKAPNVTIRGSGNVVIDGMSAYQLFKIVGINCHIEGLTFQNGRASQGGVITFDTADPEVVRSVEIVNCTFIDCQAKYGGAIYALDTVHGDFDEKSAYGLVSGCTFTRCTAGGSDWSCGGAIYGALWVEDSVFDACGVLVSANQCHTSIGATANMTAKNCVFKNQTLGKYAMIGPAYGRNGLPGEQYPDTAVRMINCTVCNNVIANYDGALFNKTVWLEGCVVSNNTTTMSLGMGHETIPLCSSIDRRHSTMVSTLFADNAFPMGMGGLPSLLNCTFVRNQGGIAYTYGLTLDQEIRNCVFWDNTEASSLSGYNGVPGLYFHGAASFPDHVTLVNTVIQNGSSNSGIQTLFATETSGESARLTAAADEAGSVFATGTCVPSQTSVLVGAGYVADELKKTVDAAGNDRMTAHMVDVGAYQSGFEPQYAPSTTDAATIRASVRFAEVCGYPKDDASGDVGEWIVLTNLSASAIDLNGVKVIIGKRDDTDTNCAFRVQGLTLPAGGALRINQSEYATRGWKKISNGELALALVNGDDTAAFQTSLISGDKNAEGKRCIAIGFGAETYDSDWISVSASAQDLGTYAIGVTAVTNALDTTLVESLKLDLSQVGAGKILMVWGGVNRGDDPANWLGALDLGSVAAGDTDLLVKAPAGYDMSNRQYRYVKFFFTADDGATYSAISPAFNLKDMDWLTSDNVRQLGPVVINEVMSKNKTTWANADGVYADWIELYNPSAYAVRLDGWGISDKPAKPFRRTIPAGVTIPSGGYLVLTCDGETRVCDNGEVHVELSLSTEGDTVLLTDIGEKTVSTVACPQQFAEVSYGLGGDDACYYFRTPTPGAENSTAASTAITPAIAFSEPHGYKDAAFNLTLSCPSDAGATIRYTLDGTSPNASSAVYAAPIAISKTTCIRAAVVDAASIFQMDCSATYLFLDDILRQDATVPDGFAADGTNGQKMEYGLTNLVTEGDADTKARLRRGFTDGIRTVSIVVDPANFFNASTGIYVNAESSGSDWRRQTMLEQIYPKDTNDEFSVSCGIAIRGNNSRHGEYPKHGFHVIFGEEYGMSRLNHPLFGAGGADSFARIDFRCEQNGSWANCTIPNKQDDNTMVHDVFSRDAQRDMGQSYNRSHYYHLFINGIYWGLYQTEERLSAEYGESYGGGDADDYDVVRTSRGSYAADCADGDYTGWTALWQIAMNEGFGPGFEDNYNRILGLNPDGTKNDRYPVYLNLPSLIDYMLVTHFVSDGDTPASYLGRGNNILAYRNRVAGEANFEGFLWNRHDCEQSFGFEHSGDGAPEGQKYQVGKEHLLWGSKAYRKGDITYLNTVGNFNPSGLHNELTSNATYRLIFADEVYRRMLKKGGAMTAEACEKRWRDRMAEIDDAVVAESARWGHGHTRASWLEKCDTCIEYINNRLDYLIPAYRELGWYPSIDAPATEDQYNTNCTVVTGTTLTFATAGADAIYITTDGTDPVEAASPAAGGQVAINLPCTVKARAKKGDEWSALQEVAYQTCAPGSDGYHFAFVGDYDTVQYIAPTGTSCQVVLTNANLKAGLVLPAGVTVKMNAAADTVNFISHLDAPNAELRLTGDGTVKFEGQDTLAVVSNLVVKAGTLQVKSTGVSATKTPVVNVQGFVEQTGGTIDLDLAVDTDNQIYGIYVANKDVKDELGEYTETIYALFDGGTFNAKIGGWKSSAVYVNKGSVEATFKGGETVTAQLAGPEARFVNASGNLYLKKCYATVTMPEDYASLTNCRVFKSDKNLAISSDGHYVATLPGAGTEVFSAGDAITVEGGTFELTASDDCFSALNNITVNGGLFYAVSTDDDVFDSNGDMEINGGTILAYATANGHEAFDVEPEEGSEGTTPHQLRINGGVIFATGGKDSAWPANVASAVANLYTAVDLDRDDYSEKYLTVENESGIVYTAKLPAFPKKSCALLVSCPNRTADAPTTASTKPTEGDQNFHELYIYEKAATNQGEMRFLEIYGSTLTNDVYTSGDDFEYIVLTNVSAKTVSLEGLVVTSAKYDTDKGKADTPKLNITLGAKTIPAHGSVRLEMADYPWSKPTGWSKITNGSIYMTLTDSAGNPVQTAYATFDNDRYPKTDMLGASLVAKRFDAAMLDTTDYWKSSADAPAPSDPFPEPAEDTPAAVKAAIDAGGFTGSVTNITTKAVYDDFRDYCKGALAITDPANTTGNVKDNAYLSYVLAAGPIDKALAASDYRVKTFASTTGGYAVKVEISGVTIGASCKTDLLSTVIGASGSDAADGEYLPDNVTVSGHAKSDNQIEIQVAPKSVSAQFFFKANLNP